MAEELIERGYNLDRKMASRLLKVSIRTVDRYIKSKKLSTSVIDGRIWLNKKEIEQLRVGRGGLRGRHHVDMSTPEVSTDIEDDNVDSVEVIGTTDVDSLSTRKGKSQGARTVYKKLYSDLKEELREKQERLEIANYRVGQLEAQVKNSIPMLEYHKECYENKKLEDELNQKLEEQIAVVGKISSNLKYEKFNKRIFLIILLFVLALQPLWILFIYNK